MAKQSDADKRMRDGWARADATFKENKRIRRDREFRENQERVRQEILDAKENSAKTLVSSVKKAFADVGVHANPAGYYLEFKRPSGGGWFKYNKTPIARNAIMRGVRQCQSSEFCGVMRVVSASDKKAYTVDEFSRFGAKRNPSTTQPLTKLNESLAKRIAQHGIEMQAFDEIAAALLDKRVLTRGLPDVKREMQRLADMTANITGNGVASKATRDRAAEILFDEAMKLAHPDSAGLVNNPKPKTVKRNTAIEPAYYKFSKYDKDKAKDGFRFVIVRTVPGGRGGKFQVGQDTTVVEGFARDVGTARAQKSKNPDVLEIYSIDHLVVKRNPARSGSFSCLRKSK